MKNKIFKLIGVMFGVSLLIFIIGLSISDIFVTKKEQEIRKDLFSRLETISNSLDGRKFESLTSTPEDNLNQDYQILRNILIEVGKLNQEFGVRWIYAFVPKEGQIVFSVDSITTKSQ